MEAPLDIIMKSSTLKNTDKLLDLRCGTLLGNSNPKFQNKEKEAKKTRTVGLPILHSIEQKDVLP